MTDKGNGLDTVTGRMVVRNLHLDGAGTRKYHIDVHSTAGSGITSLANLPHLVQ